MTFDLGVFFALLAVGYIFGRTAELQHFKSIREREAQLSPILTFSAKTVPSEWQDSETELVAGNVVISIDYFKRVAASLRNIFGGRMSAYETLIDRARREAILRMKHQAAERGAHAIFNVKLETASISKGNRDQIGSVEVVAYGTALRRTIRSQSVRVDGPIENDQDQQMEPQKSNSLLDVPEEDFAPRSTHQDLDLDS